MTQRHGGNETKRALIVGAAGIVGHALAEHLVAEGWTTFGLARHPSQGVPGLKTIRADQSFFDLFGRLRRDRVIP